MPRYAAPNAGQSGFYQAFLAEEQKRQGKQAADKARQQQIVGGLLGGIPVVGGLASGIYGATKPEINQPPSATPPGVQPGNVSPASPSPQAATAPVGTIPPVGAAPTQAPPGQVAQAPPDRRALILQLLSRGAF